MLLLPLLFIALMAAASTVIFGSGPVDYREFRLTLLLMVLFAGSVAFVAIRQLGRTPIVLDDDGVRGATRQFRWADVVSIKSAWTPVCRHPRLMMRDGGRRALGLPQGAWWRRRDPAFEHTLEALREWARSKGAPLDESHDLPRRDAPKRAGGRPVLMTSLIVTVLVAVVAAKAAVRGVITPWAPIASSAPTACPALAAAHLDRIWPPDTRKMDGEPAVFHDRGADQSICTWGRPDTMWPYPAKQVRAPFTRLKAQIIRDKGDLTVSPLASGISQMEIGRQDESAPQDVSDLGDTAYATTDPSGDETHAKVVARRANVIVSVEATADDASRATTAAHDLTAAILAQIELG
jgi:hypothetical protein